MSPTVVRCHVPQSPSRLHYFLHDVGLGLLEVGAEPLEEVGNGSTYDDRTGYGTIATMPLKNRLAVQITTMSVPSQFNLLSIGDLLIMNRWSTHNSRPSDPLSPMHLRLTEIHENNMK